MNEQTETLPAPHEQPTAHQQQASPNSDRFRAALGILAGIAIVAVAVAIAVTAGGNTHTAQEEASSWSDWQPTTSGTAAVAEIADRVAPYYRLDAAHQLAVVNPVEMTSATSAEQITGSGLTVALNSGSSGASSSSSSLSLLSGQTIGYNLCGTSTSGDCTLAGTPSQDRLLLMRRMALELALYTLNYVPSTNNVLVMLPPGHTPTTAGSPSRKVTQAVLFDRAEMQPWLNVPLSNTLTQYPPSITELPAWAKTQEAELVDGITGHGLFTTKLETDQEGGKLLVLTQLPTQ